MRKSMLCFLILLLTINSSGLNATEQYVYSPDRQLIIRLHMDDTLAFSVFFRNEEVIKRSPVSLMVDTTELGLNPILLETLSTTVDETIRSVVPNKSAQIRDFFNESRFVFEGNYSLILRAYNDGVAYRFETDFEGEITVKQEIMQLQLAAEDRVFYPQENGFVSHYERYYVDTTLHSLQPHALASLPTLLQTTHGVNVLISEADLVDYPALFLRAEASNSLHADFPKYVLEANPKNGTSDRNQQLTTADYLAKTTGRRSFPWRVFVITDDDRKLVESNLVYQLSRPLQLEETSWIAPGKVAWDWWNDNNITGVDFEAGINNDTYKYYIDFASRFGLEYIILDEGWSVSTTNLSACNDQIDVEELVAYGKAKGVGIILWVLWGPLDKDMEATLDLYAGWGVKGIKVDFMQRADQYMVNYYERVAREAAKRNMVVDFHGAFKPAGLRRAYPNVLSYEGLRGQEQCKWTDQNTPTHNLILPFIRMVAGPMDYTPGAMNNALSRNFNPVWSRPMSMGTRCHQLAMYVVYESPLQMLCDSPSNYYKEEECTTFISQMPTVWDETRVLEAEVGACIVVARRSGNNWYVGAMTNDKAREFQLDLDFLSGGSYQAFIMQDGLNASRNAEDYARQTMAVNRRSTIKIKLAAEGGWAGILKLNNDGE